MTTIPPVSPADAVRARVPAVLLAQRENEAACLGDGLVDGALKELCARYLAEDDDVLGALDTFTPREQAALAWTDAIAWDSARSDDALWERLHAHFTDPQLVELGYAIAFLFGQQRWLATLRLGP